MSAFILRSLATASASLALLAVSIFLISSTTKAPESLKGVTSVLLAWYGASGSKGEQWLWSESKKVAKEEASKEKKGHHQSALSKVIAAAKAAAEQETGKIRAADAAIIKAQKGLGRNAVSLHLLTDSSDDISTNDDNQPKPAQQSDLSDQDVSSLIEASKKDKLAMPALAAAERAAEKNRNAMANAQRIIRQSEELLGHNAAKELYSLPSLGSGGGGSAGARTAALARLSALARRTSLAGAPASARGPGAGAWARQARAEREERSFLRATKFAREMP